MGSRQLTSQQIARIAGTLGTIGAVTVIFAKLVPVNPTTAGFIYLITILLIATTWGVKESVTASVVATLFFNFFFFPPVGTFTIADPHNWIALAAFLATALIASQLSERARNRTQQAIRQQIEMQRLYDLSRAILVTSSNKPLSEQITQEMAKIYELPAVAIFDQRNENMQQAGTFDFKGVTGKLHDAATRGAGFHDPITATTVAPIRLGAQLIGSLALQGAMLPDTALQALSNLIAVGLEGVRVQEAAARAEAARHNQEFKSTLLDALAHEFKTPLTSIKAATSAILSNGVPQPDQQRELLTVIDQEADRLVSLVTDSIQLARIEAGKILLQRQHHPVHELIQAVLVQLEIPLEGRTVNLSIGENVPSIDVDGDLMRLALKQLVDNAIKYSPPDSPIAIQCGLSDTAVTIRVHNEGRGVPREEHSNIFGRFYRGQDTRLQIAGSGMGLAIAREIIQAHGGDLHVESGPGKGVDFVALVPLIPHGESA